MSRPNPTKKIVEEIFEEIISTFQLKIDSYNKERLIRFLFNRCEAIRTNGIAEGLREGRKIFANIIDSIREKKDASL